jgi:hypothetical protein
MISPRLVSSLNPPTHPPSEQHCSRDVVHHNAGYTCTCRNGFVRGSSQTTCVHAPSENHQRHDKESQHHADSNHQNHHQPAPEPRAAPATPPRSVTMGGAMSEVSSPEGAAAGAKQSGAQKSWVVAIPLVFQTGCADTNLEPSRVARLNERRATMMEQLGARLCKCLHALCIVRCEPVHSRLSHRSFVSMLSRVTVAPRALLSLM